MRIILIALLSIAISVPYHADAVACPPSDLGQEACNAVAGCGWDGATCAECETNEYSTVNTKCLRCPTSHGNSAQGSTSIDACYTTCGTGDGITEIKIYCNAATVAGNIECTKDCTDATVADVTCADGYIKNPDIEDTEKITDENRNTICIKKIGCSKVLTDCPAGPIQGDAIFENGAWNYSKCKCTAGIDIQDNGDDVGRGTKNCTYAGEATGQQWQCEITVNSCIVGYCEIKDLTGIPDVPKTCSKAPKGYYHSNDQNATCAHCPMGSTTSKAGSEAKTDCYIDSQTKFVNGDGSEFSVNGTYNAR